MSARKVVVQESPGFFRPRNIVLAIGAVVLLPYLLRRLMPLFSDNPEDTSARDLILAGKDSVRDAADDFNVGGVTGTLQRGVNRVVDHMS